MEFTEERRCEQRHVRSVHAVDKKGHCRAEWSALNWLTGALLVDGLMEAVHCLAQGSAALDAAVLCRSLVNTSLKGSNDLKEQMPTRRKDRVRVHGGVIDTLGNIFGVRNGQSPVAPKNSHECPGCHGDVCFAVARVTRLLEHVAPIATDT